MAIPLHNHSEYSAIDGLSKITEIADRAEQMGCPCCGLTDHGVVAGHLELDKVFRKRGLKPIFGCELYHGTRFGEVKGAQRDQNHLIALAMTDEGLKNLWRLNDIAAHEERFHHVGRNHWDDFKKHKEGLVVTSACAIGLVPQGLLRGDYTALNQYLDIFGENFYMEISTYPGWAVFSDRDFEEGVRVDNLNEIIVDAARERGIPIVYGDDGHYAFHEQFEAHDAYVARGTGQTIFTPPEERKMYHPEGALCIKTEDEVRDALSYLPDDVVDEAIANSHVIGERADAHLPEVRRHLPVFVPNESPWVEKNKYEDDEADLLFLDLVEEGMKARYGDDPDEQVIEKTMYEAEVFLEAGLHHYFLLGWDTMKFADDPSAVFGNVNSAPIERGPGRGSSAGSIVAFELDITDVNPLPYDLIFERFWNPGRTKGFPDIDSDFEKSRRREIKDYLEWRWGHDRVRSIGTVGRMMPLAVIEKMQFACGVSDAEAKELKKIVEKTPDLKILGPDQIGWSRENDPGKVYYVMETVGEKIVEWIEKQPQHRQSILVNFIDLCDKLCNRVFNYGVHASGIVISDADLPEIAPCRFAPSATQRVPVTQFAMDDIDALMLVKFDALGLRTLDVLADWKRQMKEDHDIDIDWSQLEWDDHPQEMWELMDSGFAAGVFQIEKGMAKKIAEELHPRSVADMSLAVALNRPGPLSIADSLIQRRAGKEDIAYDSPFLEDILEPTYGWFLYQESVIRYFSKLGYSDSEADVVRKILGKKQPEKWVALFRGEEEWEGKGYIEMAAKAGLGDLSKTKARDWTGQDVVDESTNKPLWNEVKEPAWVIWRRIVDFAKYSFNKAHSVAYGTIAFRTIFAKYYGPSEFYKACIRHVDDAKKAERIPFYINEARRMDIRVLPPDILRSQPYITTESGDILFGFSDVKGVGADSGEVVVWVRKDYDVTAPETLTDALTAEGKKWSARKKEAQLEERTFMEKSPKSRLKSNQIEALFNAGAWDAYGQRDIPLRDKQKWEKELLGVIVSDDSATVLRNNYDRIAECDTYEDALADWDGEERVHTLCGTISGLRETHTRKEGKAMGIVTIEYEGDELEFAVFPAQWKSYKFLWKERQPGIFTIRYSLNKQGEPGYNFKQGEKLS